MSPACKASRATLIRRLYFDLVGLPPSHQEVADFVADPSEDAYERLVDSLLASPAYGERWARHWLDIVHYGETHGYDKDKPRPSAWPYRDYCIRSFNNDLPYRQFVREQLAADAFSERSHGAMEALGFLSAGPWDFIGHAEVPETKIDGKIARHLDRDDMVQTTMLTFLSVTAGCAQCHNHKFDPISQEEYYGLQSIFAAIDRTEIEYYEDSLQQTAWQALQEDSRRLERDRSNLEQEIRRQGGDELTALDKTIEELRKDGLSRPEAYGYHSAIANSEDEQKWVQVDLGESTEIVRIEWTACHDDFNGIGAGFGYPKRFRIDGASDPSFETEVVKLVDRTESNQGNPGCEPIVVDVPKTLIRYLRMTATKLATRQNDYIFSLAELRAIDTSGRNVAEGKNVQSLDSIEAPVRWSRQNLVDGKEPRVVTDKQRKEIEERRMQFLAARVEKSLLERQAKVGKELDEIRQRMASMPARKKTFAGAVHFGSGAFQGTGASGGVPRTIHVLARGDIRRPTEVAIPKGLNCIPDGQEGFRNGLGLSDAQRRLALAEWIVDDANPLVWRSMANRIWQYHFGVGLVDTPNDFGRMGGLPTHPELLDYLAEELRRTQSVKHLHRLIVTSSTYRQESSVDVTESPVKVNLEKDAQNRYLWRMNRRRLEAEAIRDALLAVSGNLDRTMGGPSFQDFVVEHPEHSPHYEYHLHDIKDPRAMRRSVYRMIVRSQTQPFLTTLDCADPSIQVERRNESNSALQALALLNDSLSLHAAESLAKESGAGTDRDVSERVRTAFEAALSRSPDDEELKLLVEYAKIYGFENACRAILNLNEFVYVD